MLEAGVDILLETEWGDGVWKTVFIDAVEVRSTVNTPVRKSTLEYAKPCQEILKHMLDFGEPFIYLNGTYRNLWGEECSALPSLADSCGYCTADTIDVVDKAIILLSRKADISCRDKHVDTVLHTLLKCKRNHEQRSRINAWGWQHYWDLPLKAPKDLLVVFITAGADVYATNDDDETPSMVALQYGREDEWIGVLELCGYDSREVLACCIHYPTHEHQTSKLSFQEYCQQRQHPGRFEEVESEDIDNDVQYGDGDAYGDDNHEEMRVVTDNTECVEGCIGNMEIFSGVECTDFAMGIVLDSEDNTQIYNAEETVDYPQVLGHDDIVDKNNEGIDVNFHDWLENDGMFLETPFE